MPGGVVEKMHGFWRKRAVDTTAYERAMKEQAAKLTILTYGLQRQMAFGPDWGDGSGICTSCHSSMFIGFSGPIPCCFVGHNYVGHNYILAVYRQWCSVDAGVIKMISSSILEPIPDHWYND